MDLERLSRKDLIRTVKELEQSLANLQSVMYRELSDYKMKTRWTIKNDHIFNEKNKYNFITQTFDQTYFLPANHNNQIEYMLRSIDSVQHLYNLDYIHFSLENHQSGVVHMHAIIHDSDYNTMIEFAYDLRSYFTNTPKYKNPHNQKVEHMKQTQEDYDRVMKYIDKDPILTKTFNVPMNAAIEVDNLLLP